MKSLVYGCAAAALLCGLAAQAYAEIRVQDSPVHAVPLDEENGAAGPQVAEPAEIAKAEPAAVKALIAPKAPQQAALTPDETAFFAVLGARVTDAASTYETYVRRTTAIDPAFAGSASVTKAVKTSAAYQPRQLEAGIVAYAALVALRNPAFVEGVRAMDPRFTETLSAQPGRVMQVRGAYEAAADVAGVLRAQGEALTAAGKAITKAAYDIQSQAWSKTPVTDPKAVLADAEASAEAPRMATIASKEKLLASLVTAPQSQAGQRLDTPDVVRGLALAAMAITGHTGDGREAEYEALLHDASSADCLKTAKMNLNQCLAVAGPHYEDVYCAGRHAVSDTGKCVSAAAVGGSGADAAPPAPPAPRPQTAEIGREQAAAYGRPAAPEAEDDDDDGAVVAPPSVRQAQAQAQAQPMPAPRAYPQPQPAPQAYARNDYSPPQAPYPQPEYNPPQYQPQYAPQPQAQYQPPQYPQQPAYQQAYAPPQPQYQQPYRQPQQAYGYANPQQQPYYPQPGYPQQSYYGR